MDRFETENTIDSANLEVVGTEPPETIDSTIVDSQVPLVDIEKGVVEERDDVSVQSVDNVCVSVTEIVAESTVDIFSVEEEVVTAEEKEEDGLENIATAATGEVEIVTQLSPPTNEVSVNQGLTEAQLELLYDSKKIQIEKEALARAQQRNASWLVEKKSAEQIIDDCLKPYADMYEQVSVHFLSFSLFLLLALLYHYNRLFLPFLTIQAHAVRLQLEAMGEELRRKRCLCKMQDDFITEEPVVDCDELQLEDLQDEGDVVKTKKFKKH